MGRLIDADALIENIKKQKSDNDVHCRMCIDAIAEMVEEQPTAYDVDAVVEQIMVLHDEGYCPNEDGLECVLDKACSDCYREKVADIVRKGGKE